MNWFPMHSWHPVLVHFPLVALLLAVVADLIALRGRSERWRHAAGAFWLVGLLGAAATVGTGLLAYNRVDHSEDAHGLMTLHRNVALAATGLLVFTAIWRRKPTGATAPADPRADGSDRPHHRGVYRRVIGLSTRARHSHLDLAAGHPGARGRGA